MSEEWNTLEQDTDGLMTYEYIVNRVEEIEEELPTLADIMKRADHSGQFLASTARFLAAVDRDRFSPYLAPFIEGALERDKERKYIGSLLEAIWGADYKENIENLTATDDNFRRIYKRIYGKAIM
ncbi:MAG: hypothetical protein HDS70_00815 [Bacteroidales bacterium]|nr:hypothetical protein [Bacteroidales bacterium]MBD5220900.1 hypothetical protein [Bacteroidales bacterium]